MKRSATWTCQRQSQGRKCSTINSSRKRNCRVCGKRRYRRAPKHMIALQTDYAMFIELTGGEFCAICGRKPSGRRRLDRDHDHRSGLPRALLCSRCNRGLPSWVTAEWLRAAADYLDRAKTGRISRDTI